MGEMPLVPATMVGFGRDEALAVKFAIRAGVSLISRGEEVGGDVSGAGDVGDDLDFFLDVGELGEELSLGVALEKVFRNGAALRVGVGEAGHVGVVEEDLGLEDFSGLLGDVDVLAFEDEIEEDFDGLAALHVGEELEGEVGSDLGDGFFTADDLTEEVGLFNGCGSGAGESIVDEELEGFLAVLVGWVFDLCDDLGDEGA